MQFLSSVSRHLKSKQRAAVGGILTLVIILSIIAGAIGLVTIQLQSANFAGLEASGTALKAQQLAKIKAIQADVTAYANADTLAEARQLIGPTDLYRETVISPEATNPDGTKEKTISIKVYKSSTSTVSIFELNTVLSNKATVQAVPTGSVIWFVSLTPPSGFIICNGQSTAAYPDLAKIVGATVPDLRGEFIKGLDLGRGLDEEPRSIRSIQLAGLPNITGQLGLFLYSAYGGANGAFTVSDTGGLSGTSGSHLYQGGFKTATLNAASYNSIYGSSNTVRPRNVALLPCIKT